MNARGDRVLITGATGYVGGRLVRALEVEGVPMRCLARRPAYLAGRVAAATEVVQGDCLDPSTLPPALAGIDVAYYLVHSMGSGGDFEREDRAAAQHFANAARAAGVRRIVYLGGLGDDARNLSRHLRSRHETGAILASTGVAVIEFRASIVLGSGSLSYELIRALMERLPIMLCPRWVETMAQPIAIEDLLAYLVAARGLDEPGTRVFEIGGADRTSYGDIMREYARQRGLRRLMIPVPVLSPRLSALWLGLTSPIYARVGRKLVESLRNPTIVTDDAALRAFAVRPMGLQQAITRSLANEDHEFAETRWSDAVSSAGHPTSFGGNRFGSRLVDSRAIHVPVPPSAAFAPIRRIGGARGWYFANALWRVRGFIDLLVGGAGMRRGRRDPEHLVPGDALDFWRVEAFEPDRRLRLSAEMRLPGRAWLEFEVTPDDGGATIRQTAIFDPAGLAGLAYWYGIYGLHARVFDGMLRAIGRHASGISPAAPHHDLRREQWVPSPVGTVFPFFADARNLETITPPFLRFRVLRTSTPDVQAGTRIDYRLRLHGLPMHWQSIISQWTPNRSFVDEQVRGPYQFWHHTHEFESRDGGTLVRDIVRYALPFGSFGDLAAGWLVRRDLGRIFDYRSEAIRTRFDPTPTIVAIDQPACNP